MVCRVRAEESRPRARSSSSVGLVPDARRQGLTGFPIHGQARLKQLRKLYKSDSEINIM